MEPMAQAPQATPADMPDDEILYELADLFRVFGDSTRIKILYALHDQELCVQDIAAQVGLSQSAVSHRAQHPLAGDGAYRRMTHLERTGTS